MSEKDDEDNEDRQSSPALELVNNLVSEQRDDEGDESDNDDPCCLRDLVCSWDGTKGGSADDLERYRSRRVSFQVGKVRAAVGVRKLSQY